MTPEAGATQASPQALAEIGKKLEARREQLGRSLSDAERDLKIRRSHLVALETGSSHLPLGLVYQIGFLRSYADYLGLDGGELVAAFRSAIEAPGEPAPDGGGHERKPPSPEQLPLLAERLAVAGRHSSRPGTRRIPLWVVLVLFLAAVVIAAYAFQIGPFSLEGGQATGPSGPGGGQTPAGGTGGTGGPGGTTTPGQGTTPPGQGNPPPGEPAGGGSGFSRDKVTVVSDRPSDVRYEVDADTLQVGMSFADYVWVRVLVDGRVVDEGVKEPGASAGFEAEESIELRLGRASLVNLSVFGVAVGPAGPVDDARTVIFQRKR